MEKLKINKKPNKTIILISLIVIFSLTFGLVLAESISGDNVIVESGETLEKTSFLSGNNIRIDGDINSTTFITGGTVELNGNIDGDLFVASQNVTINGKITGSLFTASQNININGIVENNIYLAGAMLKVKSQIDGSAFLAGQNIYIEDGATISKDAFIGASKIYHNGAIYRDLTSSSQSLSIGGKIGGDLNYRSNDKADFLNGSKVVGETKWKKVDPKTDSPKSMFSIFNLYMLLFSILASLVIWLFIRLISPNFWTNLAEGISIAPLKTLGFGFLALILTPIASVILMITVIGIPLSFILLSLYIILIYISKIIVSTLIGFWFQKKFNLSNGQTFWLFLLGLIILSVLEIIPIVGWILGLLIASLGFGFVVLYMKNNYRKKISKEIK